MRLPHSRRGYAFTRHLIQATDVASLCRLRDLCLSHGLRVTRLALLKGVSFMQLGSQFNHRSFPTCSRPASSTSTSRLS